MKSSVVVATLLVSYFISYAQISDAYINATCGIAVPLNDFADGVRYSTDGNAKVGPSVGFQFCVPLSTQFIQWQIQSMLIINFFDKDLITDSYINITPKQGGTYFNIPVLTGIKTDIPVTPLVDITSAAGLGINIYKQMEIEATGEILGFTGEGAIVSEMATVFAWVLELGAVLDNKIVIGIKYLSLGDIETTYRVYDIDNKELYSRQRNMDAAVLNFYVGYKFD